MSTSESLNSRPALEEIDSTSAPPITRDDEALIGIMLQTGTGHLYDRLVNANRYRAWQPEEMERAQEGMRELFEAEMEPMIRFREPGIGGARAGIARYMNGAEEETQKRVLRNGRRLIYQNTDISQYMGDLGARGDFLHFGVHFSYADEPDRFVHGMRVYVTPRLDAVGHIAASIIRKTRENGIEVSGKLWDESTDNDAINCRKDRLIFYAPTQRHLDAILQSLKVVEAAEPELFEDNPPLLSESMEIRGVGLAEELPQDSVLRSKSYHESRQALLQSAWNRVLDKFIPLESGNRYQINKRSKELKEKIANDQALKSQVVESFRESVGILSHAHGVSADRFSMNLREEDKSGLAF